MDIRILDFDNIPMHWVEATLCDISDIVLGQSPPSSTYNFEKMGLPFFQGKAEFTNLHPTVVKWCDDPNKIAEVNDILLCVRAPVGATNVADQKCCIGRGLAAIRYPSCYKYILYFFKLIEEKLDECGTGTTFRAISGEVIRCLMIPLPPLPEQNRIVGKIEELFSELDKGLEALKTIQQQLKVYRQSVLKWAFEGKLTEEWRKQQKELHSAEALLEEIRKERAEREQASGKKNRKNNAAEKINSGYSGLSLPKGWCWVKLWDIAKEITDGDHQPPPKATTGIPFITISNIGNDNRIDFTRTFYVSKDYYHKLKNSKKPQKGDVLYTVTGSFGIPVLINFDFEFCFQRHIGLIRPEEKIVSNWMYYLLQAPDIFRQAKSVSTGTAQKTVPLEGLRNYIIPLLSTEEQHAIVNEIDSRLSVADKLEEIIEQSLKQSEAMRQSILKKAFEGRLLSEQELAEVRSDPDWEPASVLVERIKAQKANSEPKKNGKRGKKQA